MNKTIRAFTSSLGDTLNPKIWIYLLAPLLASLVVGIVSGLWFIGYFVNWVIEEPPLAWLISFKLFSLATVLATLGGWIIIFAGMYLLASFITAIWLVPVLVKETNKRYYPNLRPLGNDSFFSGVGITLSSLLLFVFWWVITIPLWFVPGLVLLVPLLLMAWLNRRLYTLDVLLAHATMEEIECIREQESGSLMLLGLIYGVLTHIPILNLIVSPVTALGYIHFCMRALEELRLKSSPIENSGTS